MSRKQNAVITPDQHEVFSNIDMETLEHAKAVITECQLKAEGLAERIAGQLYLVSEKKLYMIDDYKTLHEWAGDTFDISKGTCSDAVNTYKRFGSRDTLGEIDEKYCEYSFSTLMRMKNLSDEQIVLAGINPAMSRSQVVNAIKSLKVIEEKEAQRPKLEKEWTESYKKLSTRITDAQARIDWILEIAPEFFDKDHHITVGEYETLISAAKEFIDNFDNAPIEDAAESSAVEKVTENTDTTESNQPVESSINHSTGEPKADTSATHDEPHAMPQEIINLSKYYLDGKLTKKILLEDVWKAIQKVEAHECDCLITFTL